MREWAQILDAHEVEAGGLKTWYECWSLVRQEPFSFQIRGAAPLDIGHIVVVNDEGDSNTHGVFVLQFDSMPEDMAERLVVTPVSYNPKEARPFQTPEWEANVEQRDDNYHYRLANQRTSPLAFGKLYSWCSRSEITRSVA